MPQQQSDQQDQTEQMVEQNEPIEYTADDINIQIVELGIEEMLTEESDSTDESKTGA